MTRRWKRGLAYLGPVLLLLVLGLMGLTYSGLAERWARTAIIGQLEKITGGRVELESFRFWLLDLRAELDGLVIHGREPEGAPAFFRTDRLIVDLSLLSVLTPRISLDEIRLDRPAVRLRFEDDGSSNFPGPKRQQPTPAIPWRERLFDLAIRRVSLNQGELFVNDKRIPLLVEGGQFTFALDFHAPQPDQEFYRGELRWQELTLAAKRYIPFESDVAMKFTLRRDAVTLDELSWKLPGSTFRIDGTLTSFARPEGNFRYRAALDLADVRTILRKPRTPDGQVEVSGEGAYTDGDFTLQGGYTARRIAMPYDWFHTSGIESRGRYRLRGNRLEVRAFEAQALGGVIRGSVDLQLDGLKFRVDSQSRGMRLAQLLAAINNPRFPIATLPWNAVVDVDSVTTWEGDFQHVRSQGQSVWEGPTTLPEGRVPVTARMDYLYVMDQGTVELRQGVLATPTSRLEMEGRLGANESALAVKADIRDLRPWTPFIFRISGLGPEPEPSARRVLWEGQVLGPLSRPTFVGRTRALQAAYGHFYWDELEGDLTYSPDQFRFERASARRGGSSAEFDLELELSDWRFLPQSRWAASVARVRAWLDDLQPLLQTCVPVRGQLTGAFQGQGTREQPQLTGRFEVADIDAWGFRFERAHGTLDLSRQHVRISDAEVRKAGGTIRGDFLYSVSGESVNFHLRGAAIPIEEIQRAQTDRFLLGGQLSFEISGEGPVRAPRAEGSLTLADFRVGKDSMGSFQARLRADGRRIRAALSSSANGQLQGELQLTLNGDYPLDGELNMQGLDLDAFLENAFRLEGLTGHSRVDGRFKLAGLLARPETLTVEADISGISFEHQNVKLQNEGPIRLVYRRDEVRVEQARLRSDDTDFSFSGRMRFAADRQLDLNVSGVANLQLLKGFWPQLETRGTARISAAIQGTVSSPRVTGRLGLTNAVFNYGDFPAGLSQVTGELVFDQNRLRLENVSAEAGGGKLILGGTVTYGDGPVRYDLTTQAERVRIRYPEGMSWLLGGTLRLTGTPAGGRLSGRVVVERLLLARGFDLAGLLTVSQATVRAPTATSPYLRNLQFDIEALSSPTARLEWNRGRFETEASLRLRGTWEHPILLGHIRLLTGEVTFRGNRYTLSRGDINFANPFRVDPVLNVELTTTIRQYEATLNFNGPLSQLTLAYRSDPPLPTSDIITLLALGRTGPETTARSPVPVQTPELGATTLLSEAISSQLSERIERLFGVSRFRVDPFLAGTGSEQNASARITVEQQVTRDLTITYVTNVTSTQQQVIQVEYAVSRDVSIVGLRDQNGTFGLDVKFRKRFD